MALVALGAAGVIWLDGRMQDAATARAGVRHAALHINCPPGSHGVPRYAKFGQSLGYGPDGKRATHVRDRSLTVTMPPRPEAKP